MPQANMGAVERIKAAREKSLRLMQMDADGSLDKYLKEGKMNQGAINQQMHEAPTPRRVPKMALFIQNRIKLLFRRRVARVFFCFYDRNKKQK